MNLGQEKQMKYTENLGGKMEMTIKEIREALKMTQSELAYKLGCGWVTVCRWENGKSKPSPVFKDKLNKLIRQIKREAKDGHTTS